MKHKKLHFYHHQEKYTEENCSNVYSLTTKSTKVGLTSGLTVFENSLAFEGIV